MPDLDQLRADLLAAKEAYRDDPSPENRERHRAASEAMADARAQTRPAAPVVGGDAETAPAEEG